jgi:hypothetical protein
MAGTGVRATVGVEDRMYSTHGTCEHRGTLTKQVWPVATDARGGRVADDGGCGRTAAAWAGAVRADTVRAPMLTARSAATARTTTVLPATRMRRTDTSIRRARPARKRQPGRARPQIALQPSSATFGSARARLLE